MSNNPGSAKGESTKSKADGSPAATDVDALAQKVYELLKQELRIERERLPRSEWTQE